MGASYLETLWIGGAQVLVPGGISWLRLDGGVEATRRFGVVQAFNADPSIDVMLLTTAVRPSHLDASSHVVHDSLCLMSLDTST